MSSPQHWQTTDFLASLPPPVLLLSFFFFKGNNFSIVKHIVRDVAEAKSLNEFKKGSAEF